MGVESGVNAGTGVKVGISVDVGMLVAAGTGVHVGGRVIGAAVAWDCEPVMDPHEAERRMSSRIKPGGNFFCKRRPSLQIVNGFGNRIFIACA